MIEDKKKALLEVKARMGNLKLYCNRSKLENRDISAAVV